MPRLNGSDPRLSIGELGVMIGFADPDHWGQASDEVAGWVTPHWMRWLVGYDSMSTEGLRLLDKWVMFGLIERSVIRHEYRITPKGRALLVKYNEGKVGRG